MTSVLCIMKPSLLYFGALYPEKCFLVNLYVFHLSFSSVAQSCPTLGEPTDCSTPGLPVYHQFLGFTKTHVHWVDNAIQPLILCRPLFLLPSIFPSIRVFGNESECASGGQNWSFSFNISPTKKHLGLISLRMDCLNLLAVQGTLKNRLQQHSSKASILWHSAFFMLQLSHLIHNY